VKCAASLGERITRRVSSVIDFALASYANLVIIGSFRLKTFFVSSMLCGAIGSAAFAKPTYLLPGYYQYYVGRAEDNKVLYQSTVFLKPVGEKVSIYRTVKKDPLGKFIRCGGLGCDLEKHDLIGTLNIKNSSSGLRVVRATGSSKFLLNSICSYQEGPNDYSLLCRSKILPMDGGVTGDAVVAFIPGS
jgi:hypothetical protein